MQRSKGQRQGTRSILRRRKHEQGRIYISRILHEYSAGDRVAIVLDGGQQMGMPHRRFHGRTGFIQERRGKAWVVGYRTPGSPSPIGVSFMSDDEGIFTDFSSVRDLLLDAQERRGFLTYEQKAALQHAEWAASDNRNGYKTEGKVFTDMFNAIMEIKIFHKYPELAAKLAELMPLHNDDVRAVIASRRISIETEDVEAVLNIVRQHVGVE